MKKTNLSLIAIALLALSLFLHSCEKEMSLETITLIDRAKSWYNKTNERTGTRINEAANSNLIKNEIWEKAKVYSYDEEDIIAVPVEVKMYSGLDAKGDFMLFVTKIDGEFKSTIAYNENEKYFSGSFSANQISEIYNGAKLKIESHKKSNNKSSRKGEQMYADSGGGGGLEGCIDWYWTVYALDNEGNILYVISESFINRTCPSGGGEDTPTLIADIRESDEMHAFEFDYKAIMSESELAIFNSMTRLQQLDYLANAKVAIDAAQRMFPNMSQTDSKADAFRHAYFTMLNVYSLGATLATNLGTAHENQPSSTGLAKQMDLFNNNAAKDAFVTYPGDTPIWSRYANLAYSLVTNGSLKYIKNGTLLPTNE